MTIRSRTQRPADRWNRPAESMRNPLADVLHLYRVQLVNGKAAEFRANQLRSEPDGSITLLAGDGLAVAAVAAGQWISWTWTDGKAAE